MQKTQLDEKKKTGASYIFTFYNEIALLTHNYVNYEGLLTELKYRYGEHNAFVDKATVEEKDVLKQACTSLRYYVSKTYIAYSSIIKNLNKKGGVDLEITALKDKIKDQYVVKQADCELYVIKLNEVLVSSVIRELLESSQELLNEIYADEQPATAE